MQLFQSTPIFSTLVRQVYTWLTCIILLAVTGLALLWQFVIPKLPKFFLEGSAVLESSLRDDSGIVDRCVLVHPKIDRAKFSTKDFSEAVIEIICSLNNDGLFLSNKLPIRSGEFWNAIFVVDVARWAQVYFVKVGSPCLFESRKGGQRYTECSVESRRFHLARARPPDSNLVADQFGSVQREIGGHSADDLLTKQSRLLCRRIRGIPGGISGLLVGAVNLDRVTGINAQHNEAEQLQHKSYIVKPVFLFLAGVFALGLGCWRLKFCSSLGDLCLGFLGWLGGMFLTTWGVLIF